MEAHDFNLRCASCRERLFFKAEQVMAVILAITIIGSWLWFRQ